MDIYNTLAVTHQKFRLQKLKYEYLHINDPAEICLSLTSSVLPKQLLTHHEAKTSCTNEKINTASIATKVNSDKAINLSRSQTLSVNDKL